MSDFTFGALIEPGDEAGFVVTFPDVPEAVTQGDTYEDAAAMAEEALGLALLSYPKRGLALPVARARERGLVRVPVAPDVAAKIALLDAFRMSGLTRAELAERLGKDAREVRRLLDPFHPSKLPAMTRALAVLGIRLIVRAEKTAA